MDTAAKTVVGTLVVDQKPAQLILNACVAMLSTASCKAGDTAQVTCEEMGGKLMAKAVTRV